MRFQLPENLINRVGHYDPTLRPLLKLAESQKSGGKPRMPLGLPTRLFPVELVSEVRQLEIVTEFNGNADADRSAVIQVPKGHIFLVHKSGTWLALWFWNKEHNKDYVYGATIAHRNTESAIERANAILQKVTLGYHRSQPNQPERVIYYRDLATQHEAKYGKTTFIEHTVYVTTEMIINGCNKMPGDSFLPCYGRKELYKRHHYSSFRKELEKHLDAWEDENSPFNRVLERGDVRRAVWPNLLQDDDTSFVDLCFELFRYNTAIKHVLDTPYFRKEANKVFEQCLTVYMNKENKSRREVERPYRVFLDKMNSLCLFLNCYPDATLDHCQKIYELATNVHRLPCSSEAVNKWIYENMPISSYLQIIEKEVTTARVAWSLDPRQMDRDRHYTTGQPKIYLRDFEDTFNMLNQLYIAQNKGTVYNEDLKPLKLQKPNRWRLSEFHDYVAGECFKITTPNEKLHQDLFPEPIKVDSNGKRWSFFQPHDVHQLAAWGRAVRNCVGSADSYRKGIKSKTHFIVLTMIDNQPRYTMQLKLSNGQLNVDQIADTCNKRLSEEERYGVSLAFTEALKTVSNSIAES